MLQTESRGLSAEIYRLKSQIEEANDQVETFRKDNKNLQGKQISDKWCSKFPFVPVQMVKFPASHTKLAGQGKKWDELLNYVADEITDLTDQLGEGGKSVHDLDKMRRKLMIEKEELQVTQIKTFSCTHALVGQIFSLLSHNT